MVATLVIFMREGIDASMIVAILLAYLNRIGQRRYFRDVFIGVGAALALAAGGGVAAYLTIRQYDGSNVQTVFETGTYLLASAVMMNSAPASRARRTRSATVRRLGSGSGPAVCWMQAAVNGAAAAVTRRGPAWDRVPRLGRAPPARRCRRYARRL